MRVLVYLDTVLVGELRAERGRVGSITGTFSYDPGYVSSRRAYAIDPVWPLHLGTWPVGPELRGALGDSSPDSWGRSLVARRLRRERPGVPAGQLDYLLGVSDVTRQGALRFTLGEGLPFEYPGTTVPRLVSLPDLMRAAESVDLEDDQDALMTLLAAGSGSLGGARPKAAVADGGDLFIAKFPARTDTWDVMGLEATALQLAAAAGVEIAVHRLVRVGDRRTLLVKRFDRQGGARIGYQSALTMAELPESVGGDYLDVAEAITQNSADARSDLAALWQRIAVNVGLNNTDDHMRNHGFLRGSSGWRLSPAFDLNPTDVVGDRATSLAGATAPGLVVSNLVEYAPDFGIDRADSRARLIAVREALTNWESCASANGVSREDQERVRPGVAAGLAALG